MKLTEDGALVPKRVAFGTLFLFYCILLSTILLIDIVNVKKNMT